MTRRVVFAMTGALGLPGGIARANLNFLQAVGAVCEERSIPWEVMAYHERPEHRPPFLPASVRYRAYRSSKLGFSAALAATGTPGTLMIFDHVGIAGPVLVHARAGIVRTVIFAHGWEAWGRDLRPRYVRSYGSAAMVLTNSTVTLRKMRSRLPAFRGEACLLGIAPGFPIHAEIPAPTREPVLVEAVSGRRVPLGPRALLLVGRMSSLEREKGHYELLEVLPEIVRERPGTQMVFVGPGEDLPELRAIAVARGLHDDVAFTGRVDDATLNALYRNCYAFVMPSTQEGFGLVYLEAMNYGKACLGCRDQGTEDVIVDGETGVLLDGRTDLPALRDALLRLLDDPRHVAEMGRRGFERLHATFTADAAQGRIRAALAKVI